MGALPGGVIAHGLTDESDEVGRLGRETPGARGRFRPQTMPADRPEDEDGNRRPMVSRDEALRRLAMKIPEVRQTQEQLVQAADQIERTGRVDPALKALVDRRLDANRAQYLDADKPALLRREASMLGDQVAQMDNTLRALAAAGADK